MSPKELTDPDLHEAIRTLLFHLPEGAHLEAVRPDGHRRAEVVVDMAGRRTVFRAEK